MKAIELSGLEGFKSLRVADVEKPKPAANQILIEVMAAGINFAELELTWGRYPALKPLFRTFSVLKLQGSLPRLART